MATTQNIKVAVRVRNLPSWHGRDGTKDGEEYNKNIVECDRPDSTSGINSHITIGDVKLGSELKEFTYDNIYAPTDNQEFLYNSLISPLIEKCQQGYREGMLITYSCIDLMLVSLCMDRLLQERLIQWVGQVLQMKKILVSYAHACMHLIL